jgi:hypothetical protein
MPKSMRPVVKLENGKAKGQEAEGVQEEAVHGAAPSRGRGWRCG